METIKIIENKPKEISYSVKSNLQKVELLTKMTDEFWLRFSDLKNHDDNGEDEHDKNYKTGICKFYKYVEKTNGIQNFKEKVKRYGYGRIYCDATHTVVTLPRLLSNFVCGEYYSDIDIINCHPVILEQLTSKMKEISRISQTCLELTEYVSDREGCFTKYKFKKNDFMKVMYCDAYSGPEFLMKINKFLLFDFYNAFSSMFPKIVEKMTKLKAEKNLKMNKPEGYNLKGGVLSMIVQTYEREIAYSMDRFFVENSFPDRCMVYDGFYIQKDFDKKEELQEFVLKNTGFNIRLAFKPTFNQEFEDLIKEFEGKQLEKPAEISVLDDYGIGEHIIEEHKDEIFKYQNEIWVWYDNIWTRDVDPIFELWIQQCTLDVGKPKEPKIVRGLTGRFKSFKTQIKNQCLLKYQNDNEKGSSLNSQKDLLPFEDGYYDFKKREFIKYTPGDKLYFTYKINQKIITEDFPESERENLRRIILDVFNSEDLMKEVLQFFCRALSNHYEDKVYTVFLGERNSGKGLLNDILQSSFGRAVGSFDFNEFIVKKSGLESSERQKGFFATFTNCCLALSQEIPSDCTINSTLIKVACSGGDSVTYRKAFERTQEMQKIRCLFSIFGQSLPGFSDSDAMENMLLINMPCKFVDQISEMNFGFIQKLADPEVKNLLKTNTMYHRMFIQLVFSYYSETKPEYKILRQATVESKEDTMEVADPYLCMKKLIFENFEFSQESTVKVLTCDVINLVKGSNSAQLKVMTSQKIGKFLETLNIKKVKSNGKTYYTNLRKIKKSDYTIEEED